MMLIMLMRVKKNKTGGLHAEERKNLTAHMFPPNNNIEHQIACIVVRTTNKMVK